jgi:hypothetical protein
VFTCFRNADRSGASARRASGGRSGVPLASDRPPIVAWRTPDQRRRRRANSRHRRARYGKDPGTDPDGQSLHAVMAADGTRPVFTVIVDGSETATADQGPPTSSRSGVLPVQPEKLSTLNEKQRTFPVAKFLPKFCAHLYRSAVNHLPKPPHAAQARVEAPWLTVLECETSSHDGTTDFAGVGVLVSPGHVLTGAHVVSPKMDAFFADRGDVPRRAEFLRVRIGATTLCDGELRTVKRIVPHPDFVPFFDPEFKGRAMPGADLAVLELAEPIDAPYLTIAARTPLRYFNPVSAFGFAKDTDGYRHLSQVNTAKISKWAGLTGKLAKREIVIANFAGPGAMGAGFSGGPLVIQPEDSTACHVELKGLLSRGAHGLPTENAYGAPGIATDLGYYAEWVAETTAAHPGVSDRATKYVTAAAETPPEE